MEEKKLKLTSTAVMGILKSQFPKIQDIEEVFTWEYVNGLRDLFNKYDISYQDVGKIINGVKKKLILSNDGKVNIATNRYNIKKCVDEIKAVNDEADLILYKKINDINEKFTEFYRKKENDLKIKKVATLMNSVWKKISESSKKINKGITDFTASALENLSVMAQLYSALLEFTPRDQIEAYRRDLDSNYINTVNDLLENYLAKGKISTSLLCTEQITNLKNTISTLLKGDSSVGLDKFTIDEVAVILKKATTVVAYASESKLLGMSEVLSDYIDTVNDQVETETGKKDFIKVSVKDVFQKSATLMYMNPKNIRPMLDLIIGASIKEVAQQGDYQNSAKVKSANMIQTLSALMPNMKLNVGKEFQKNIIEHSPTFIKDFNLSKVYKTTLNLINSTFEAVAKKDLENVVDRASYLKKIGFNLDDLYTQDNLNDIFTKGIDFTTRFGKDGNRIESNFVKNVRIYYSLVSVEDVQKIMKHNILILTKDPNETIQMVKDIIKDAKTKEDIKHNLSEFVNKVLANKQTLSSKSTTSSLPKSTRTKKEKIGKEKISIDLLSIDAEFLNSIGIKTEVFGLDNKLEKEVEIEDDVNSLKAKKLLEEVDSLEDDLGEKIPVINKSEETQEEKINYLYDLAYNLQNDLFNLARLNLKLNENGKIEGNDFEAGFVLKNSYLKALKLVKNVTEQLQEALNSSDEKVVMDAIISAVEARKTIRSQIDDSLVELGNGLTRLNLEDLHKFRMEDKVFGKPVKMLTLKTSSLQEKIQNQIEHFTWSKERLSKETINERQNKIRDFKKETAKNALDTGVYELYMRACAIADSAICKIADKILSNLDKQIQSLYKTIKDEEKALENERLVLENGHFGKKRMEARDRIIKNKNFNNAIKSEHLIKERKKNEQDEETLNDREKALQNLKDQLSKLKDRYDQIAEINRQDKLKVESKYNEETIARKIRQKNKNTNSL